MTILDLQQDEYLPYFKGYIDQAEGVSLLSGLESSFKTIHSFYLSIASEKLEYRYAEGKWTIKEIISHLIDTERIFCYRALRFARQDKTDLSGFDENAYVLASGASERSIADLLEEYTLVRKATIALFKSFSKTVLISNGIAGSGSVSVRALGFLIIGHEKHHVNVIKERYLE
ncbi:DinB family protein [Psychroserpens sp. NJDZ02]|uniref:DinB family protein n=1 Tax=Psychroserpens sp. NJDZ02 TaxID=2570561 RepID=UPI0010A89421|nr:DinB family protein [Psychroserpens sp. NJDZ02]QCE42821.1 DinB family protein [Psychroserpens sp. NJDZ02]